MKAKDVVGRKITAVGQERVTLDGDRYYDVQRLELDDGTTMHLVALEAEYEPIVHVHVTKA